MHKRLDMPFIEHPHSGSSGFALVTTAVIVMIAALAISVAAVFLKIDREQRYLDETAERLQGIEQALLNYVAQHGSFPCVASRTSLRTDAMFARATDCGSAAVPGTVSIQNPGRANRAVRIGAVPVRTLNLPDRYMYDIDNRLITYAITEIQVTSPTDINLGAVEVIDASGNSILSPNGSALFALAAHGSDAKGAFSGNGSNTPVTACTSAQGMDQENCDDDFTFAAVPVSKAGGPDYYDDFLIYATDLVMNCGTSGQIFDGTECVTVEDSFGGAYTRWWGTYPTGPEPPSCRTPNPMTGDCTCPAGYSVSGIWDWIVPPCHGGFFAENGRTINCNLTMHVCVKR